MSISKEMFFYNKKKYIEATYYLLLIAYCDIP